MTAVPETPAAPACGCPQQDGKTYHQRGTCPDPVVARLGWYGTPPVAATASAPEAAPEEIPVRLVRLWLCDLCLDGEGGECHTPGCALWINRAPDIPLRNSPFVTILEAPAPEAATPVERVALALEAERDRWRDAAGEHWHAVKADPEMARGRNAIGAAWGNAAKAVRGQLAPQWDALTAELERLRAALNDIIRVTNDEAARALASKALGADDA